MIGDGRRNDTVKDPTTGDFIGNQVLHWSPLRFAVEFSARLRKQETKLSNVPTVRQPVAMARLMTTMYYRKASLTPLDFINAAVLTTPVEDQEIARQVANSILFPVERAPKQPGSARPATGSPPVKDMLAATDQFMDELLDDLASAGLSVDGIMDDASGDMLDKVIDDIDASTQFIDEIYDAAERGDSPGGDIANFFEHRGGYTELMLHGIDTMPKAVNHAKQVMQRDGGTLTPGEIQACAGMGLAGELAAQAPNPWISLAARFCTGDPDVRKDLDTVLAGEDAGTAARTLDYLTRVGFDPAMASQLVQQLVERARNLFDIAEITKVTGRLPPFDVQRVVEASLERDASSTFATARALDVAHGSSITSTAWNRWSANHPEPTIPELAGAQACTPGWNRALEGATRREMARVAGEHAGTAGGLARLARSLHDLATGAQVQACQRGFDASAVLSASAALDAAGDVREFLDTLREIVDGSIPLPDQDVLNQGMAKHVPIDAMMEIMGNDFEVLKRLYERGKGSFKRYASMINRIGKLGYDQAEQLARTAMENNDGKGLGALAHHDLGMTFDIATRLGGDAVNAVAGALAAGPGENLLLQWFTHRAKIPPGVRDMVRRLTRDTLVTLALDLVARHRGTSEKGVVPSNQLRPYLDGDELDHVDIDATIENIISAGKSLDTLTSDDLLVVNTQKGRAALCFLLDISGSMSGAKLASCALCTVMLVGKLQPEEVAIALFESNTHVVKAFDQERDIDELADELLDLHARGGTQAQRALEWGRTQLVDNDAEFKACFLLTDCEFFEDQKTIARELEPLPANQVHFVLAVHGAYNKKTCNMMLDTTRGELLPLSSYKRMPQAIAEMLERIG